MHRCISVNLLSLAPAGFHKQVAVVARIGARAITPDVGQLDDIPPPEAARLIRDAGLIAAALTHRAFGFADAEEARSARERLNRSIDLAHEIGAQTIVMTSGGRGALDWGEAASRFSDAIAPCAETAAKAGIRLGIEPTSHLYADVSLVHRLSDCVTLARGAGIAVTIDLFACWVDADIEAAIAGAGQDIALVQVSDYVLGDRGLPCRAVPGDGSIPLDRLTKAIARAGFSGYFDLEIIGPHLQAEGVEQGLRRAAAAMGTMLDAAGLPDD